MLLMLLLNLIHYIFNSELNMHLHPNLSYAILVVLMWMGCVSKASHKKTTTIYITIVLYAGVSYCEL